VKDFPFADGAPVALERPTSWTADELMAATFPEPRYAVPGIVAEGVNLLVGAPKLGKSWLVLNIAVAVASGGQVLGKIPVCEGDVCYLALEDTARRLQSRLRMVLAGAPAPSRLVLATECPPWNEGGSDRVEKWLDATPDARAVVIDVLSRTRSRTRDNANRYDADYEAVVAVKHLADRYGVAFVLVHHTRKAASEDFIDTVSGTQGLAGAADAVLVLQRSRGAAEATLRMTGRDIHEASYALDFDAGIGTWKLLDDPPDVLALGDTRRQILRCVTEHGPLTPKAIAEAVAASYELVKKTCQRMAEDDQLTTDGTGRYSPSHVSAVPGVPGVPDPLSLSLGGHEGHEGQKGEGDQ
jgi:hypothetical protein